ncbi:MAG: hypothetical protein H6807_09690 [Planctomycetes bacterium]|nr:hypothetical protein [Planctomycetota bacterium]
MRPPLLLLLCLLAAAATAPAQYTKIVGVSGTTSAGTSFTLEIDAAPSYVRTLDFVNLPVEYSPVAMAQLLSETIQDDYYANGKTGFRAGKVTSVEGEEFDATFEIRCAAPINQIRVGMLGNPNVPLPRAPGVAFNPSITNYDADLPTPLLGPQPSHPNARFTINGQDPSTDFFRRARVRTNTVMNWRVSTGSNPNQWVTILGGPYNPGILTANWGDYMDIGTLPYVGGLPGGIFVIGDGIFQTGGGFLSSFFQSDSAGNFDLSITVPPHFAGAHVGLQALVVDPTTTAPNLRFTNAIDVEFDEGQDFLITPPASGFVPVTFSAGRTFDFYGATYSGLFVHEDGFVSFGTPGAASTQVDPVLALGGSPAVYVNWADWDLSASAIRVREFGSRLIIDWGDPGMPVSHQGDLDQAWFSAQFVLDRPLVTNADAGAILIDLDELDPMAAGGNDALVGISPGLGLDPMATAFDLGELPFGGATASAILYQSNRSGTAASDLSVPSGGPPVYRNGSKLGRRDFGFFPARPGAGPLSNRPFAIPSAPNPEDLQAVVGQNALFLSGPGGQPLLLSGYFKYLFTNLSTIMPAVILDPTGSAGLGPYLLQIDGVLSTEPSLGGLPNLPLVPGFRNWEGLRVSTPGQLPPVAPGPVDLAVSFGDGSVLTLPGAVQIMP